MFGVLGFDGDYLIGHPKPNLTFSLKNCKKSTVKHSIQKPILLNFLNLFITFCPRLQLTFTCSKSTIETQEKGVMYVCKFNNNH